MSPYSNLEELTYKSYTVPELQQCWVIRADNGLYAAHFRDGGIIAIGHIDLLNISSNPEVEFIIDRESLPAALWDKLSILKETKGKFISVYNQVITFVEKIKIGDMIIVPSYGSYNVWHSYGKYNI